MALTSASTDIKVIFLSGRSGSGKSTVAYEITHQLSQQGYPHVHIEGDNLDAIYPTEQGSELMLANLRALWSSFYNLRKPNTLLLSGTGMVLKHEDIRNVIEQTCGLKIDMQAFILTTDDATAEIRLKQREIGTDLERHLLSSRRMSKVLEEFEQPVDMPVHRVSTDGREISSLAEEIIRFARLI